MLSVLGADASGSEAVSRVQVALAGGSDQEEPAHGAGLRAGGVECGQSQTHVQTSGLPQGLNRVHSAKGTF